MGVVMGRRRLIALVLAAVLVCVPAFTRASERVRMDHASPGFRFSKSIESPRDRVDGIPPLAQISHESSLIRPPDIERPHAIAYIPATAAPVHIGRHSLRAPPPSAGRV